MIDVKVHIVHAEILETRVDHVLDMLLAADAIFNFILSSREELGCDDDLIALCEVPERASHILLAGAALVSNRCIIEIDTQQKTAFNDFSGVFLVNGPAVLAASGISESHTSHTDPRYIKV